MNIKGVNVAYLVIFLFGLLGLVLYLFIDNKGLFIVSLAFIFFGWFSMKLEAIQNNVEQMRPAENRKKHHNYNSDTSKVRSVNDIPVTTRQPRYRSR